MCLKRFSSLHNVYIWSRPETINCTFIHSLNLKATHANQYWIDALKCSPRKLVIGSAPETCFPAYVLCFCGNEEPWPHIWKLQTSLSLLYTGCGCSKLANANLNTSNIKGELDVLYFCHLLSCEMETNMFLAQHHLWRYCPRSWWDRTLKILAHVLLQAIELAKVRMYPTCHN